MVTPRGARSRIEQELLTLLGTLWSVGDRLPSTRELSRRLGTGQRNTHAAVARLAQLGYLLSRPGAGTCVVRVPDASERAALLAPPRSGSRVLLLTHDTEAHEGVARSVERHLAEQGASVLRATLDPASSDLRTYDTRDVDGTVAVFPPVRSPVRFDPAKPLIVVTNSRVLSVYASDSFDVVSVDEEQACFLAGVVARCAEATRPCVIGGASFGDDDCFDELSELRVRAFEDGYGSSLPPEHRLIALRYTDTSGARIAGRFAKLDPRPDFVFAVSDDLAIGFALGAEVLGLRVGLDYQLLGFDGQPRGRRMEHGPLTTVEQPDDLLGKSAAQFMLERLRTPGLRPRRLFHGCRFFRGATIVVEKFDAALSAAGVPWTSGANEAAADTRITT